MWALIDDFTHREDNGVDPQEILSYTSRRTAIIEVLMSEADRCGFDGINVDFEKVTEDGSQDYIQFIREPVSYTHLRKTWQQQMRRF